jgi:hypothetical protein
MSKQIKSCTHEPFQIHLLDFEDKTLKEIKEIA